MQPQERIDKILASVRKRMQEDISSLLGSKVAFNDPLSQPNSAGEFLRQLSGKELMVNLELSGDLSGVAYLFLSLRDAIRLGGTLIMLPPVELDTAVETENYGAETQDAVGEITNIIAGAFTAIFEEQFPQPVRFIRTEVSTLDPASQDFDAGKPLPEQPYYQMSMAVEVADRRLGDVHVLLPGGPFGLAGEAQPPGEPVAEGLGWESAAEAESSQSSMSTFKEEKIVVSPVEADSPATPPPFSAEPPPDPQKQRKLVDRLLELCRDKSASEVAALLGGKCVFSARGSDVLSKEALLDQLDGRQILTHLAVRGVDEGREGYLLTAVGDSVRLGGTLIMLPPGELDAAATEERFEGEVEDAFGEIGNIIAGACTSIFEEKFSKSLGFVRTKLEKIVPSGIDPDSDDVMQRQLYYVATFGVRLEEQDLGALLVALPADLLGLQLESDAARQTQAAAVPGGAARRDAEPSSAMVSETPRRVQSNASEEVDVLVVSDVESEAQRIVSVIQQQGFVARLLHLRENFSEVLSGRVLGVFLVMREVSEQGFGVAIKLRSACGGHIPLIVCGPAWTRSAVLQAVRYGADDILVTPAAPDDIAAQVCRHVSTRKAA